MAAPLQPKPVSEKVYRLPVGLTHAVDAALERIRREHEAGKIPGFFYDGPGSGQRLVRVRVVIEEVEDVGS